MVRIHIVPNIRQTFDWEDIDPRVCERFERKMEDVISQIRDAEPDLNHRRTAEDVPGHWNIDIEHIFGHLVNRQQILHIPSKVLRTSGKD